MIHGQAEILTGVPLPMQGIQTMEFLHLPRDLRRRVEDQDPIETTELHIRTDINKISNMLQDLRNRMQDRTARNSQQLVDNLRQVTMEFLKLREGQADTQTTA